MVGWRYGPHVGPNGAIAAAQALADRLNADG